MSVNFFTVFTNKQLQDMKNMTILNNKNSIGGTSQYELHHGEYLEVMAGLPDSSADAIICDPPYGTTKNTWDGVIPFQPMWDQLKRIIKPKGAIVLFGSQPFTSALVMSNVEWFKYMWIWSKNESTGFLNAKKQPLRATEDIVIFSSGQPTYNPKMVQGKPYTVKRSGATSRNYGKHNPTYTNCHDGLRYPTNLISIPVEQNGLHPTQKPVPLLEHLVKTYTNEGETVLDFTMGSGTTGVACAKTKRHFIGIELDDDYFKAAKKRIEYAYNGYTESQEANGKPSQAYLFAPQL